MAGLSLQGVSKSFGETRVLSRVDLDIKDGEFITLVGPSGCGKSTLLRIIAGLEAPSAGKVSIGGADVTAVRPSDRNLAMVFQSYALYPHLTVAENMMTPLKLRDLSAMERFPILGPMLARAKYRALREQVDETARVLKIDPLLERKPGQLSGGQRQRAALGRAMVRKPVAFLMDEPLSNLDAALRVHMRSELAELHRALKTTFIYVTHDQAEALTMSDRMAVMMGGDILQLDEPQTVYTDPVDLRVAEFVGSPKINVLAGSSDGDGRLFIGGRPVSASIGMRQNTLSIGLRPENLRLTFGENAARMTGTVRYVENLGSDIFLHTSVGDGGQRIIVRATPAEAAAISIGHDVGVTFDHGAVLAFSADGKRLPFTTSEPAREKAVA